MENKNKKSIIRRAQNLLGARTVLGVLLGGLGLMLLAAVEIRAADTGDMNIAANIVAGTLDITVPSQLNFNNGSPGQTIIANTTTSEIITNDTRGSLAGWSTTGYFNTNFLKSGDANVQMAVNQSGTLRMFWGANNGGGGSTITNVTGTSGDAIGGANNNFPGIGSSNTLTLMTNNGIDNGAGAFNMVNLKFNYSVPVAAQTGTYTTNLRLTIA